MFLYIKKNNITKFYLVASYFFIILSLGANLAYIEQINFAEKIFKTENINKFRGVLPFIILIINILIILKIKINFRKHEYLLIGLILSYLFGTFNNKIDYINIFKLHFIITPMALITTLAISRKLKELRNQVTFFYVLFFFFITVLILFYSQNNIGYGGGYISFFKEQIIFINSNGISRISCFIYFLLICGLIKNKSYFDFKSIFISTLSVFLGSLIILSEGRVNISIMLLSTLLIFLNTKINFYKKTIFFFLVIFLSFMLSNILKLTEVKKIKFDNRFEDIKIENTLSQNINKYFETDVKKIKTGRFAKWKDLITYTISLDLKTTLLGKGPETDRQVLENLGYMWNADSANSFFYSLLCGGLIGLFFYLRIIVLLLLNFKNFLLNKKQLINESLYNIFLSVFPIMLLLRSLFENSISSWSLDFIIMITCLNYFYLKRN